MIQKAKTAEKSNIQKNNANSAQGSISRHDRCHIMYYVNAPVYIFNVNYKQKKA